jgi:hypothetical protein
VWGHLQASTVFRDIAIENGGNSYNRDVFGWGARLSGALLPFTEISAFQNDTFYFGATYGEGIGAYILDLQTRGYDGAVDSTNHLKALPVFAYYIGYTHYWTKSLRSSLVFSEVDLDSIALATDPKNLEYHRGRYCAVNTVYQWEVQFPVDPDPTKNLHTAFTGIEYLFGQKETLGGAQGEDHRVTLTVGLKY